jgi:hypothetical protein
LLLSIIWQFFRQDDLKDFSKHPAIVGEAKVEGKYNIKKLIIP